MRDTTNYSMNMCEGPLFRQIIVFSLPLFLSIILQLLFNAADLLVVGHFVSHAALAAVGSTSSINSLLTALFIGLSVGANVVAANYFGGKDLDNVRRTLHTSVLLSLICGAFLAVFGFFISRPILKMMSSPEDTIDMSTIYLRICFLGMPFMQLYNYGSAVLRAVGDTRRPFYYLTFGGIVNVLLNLVFVFVFHLDVDGVAYATVISQGIAALLVCRALAHSAPEYCLRWNRLRINPKICRQIIQIGIPSGLQSCCFSISNIIIQSSINSFGSFAMAGNTAAGCMEALIWAGSTTFNQTALSFTAQNLGGRQFERIKKGVFIISALAFSVTASLGIGFYIFGKGLVAVFNPHPEVIRFGLERMKFNFLPYWLCGMMDVLSGAVRGLGKSMTTAVITLLSVCAFRIVWVYTYFAAHRSMGNLILSYPISWGMSAFFNGIVLYFAFIHLRRSFEKGNLP